MSVCAMHSYSPRQRFALITVAYPLGTSSVLMNLIEMLSRFVDLDIYTDSTSLAVPYTPPPCTKIHVWPRSFFDRLKNKIDLFGAGLMHGAELSGRVARSASSSFGFGVWLSKVLRTEPAHDVYIFANYSSLYTVSFLPRPKMSSIYYNLELLDNDMGDNYGVDWNLLTKLERDHLTYVDWVFATSPRRGELFHKLTGFPTAKIQVLPVLPLSAGCVVYSRYFYEKFGLSESTKIVLCAGSIGERLLQKELIGTVADWPKDYALILHTWDPTVWSTEYGLSLYQAAKGLPVFFSAEALSYERLCGAIASVHVGLALYDALDANMAEIFFSSNKIIEYLRCGIPVISSPNEDLDIFFTSRQCGFSGPVESLPHSLAVIERNYAQYQEGAFASLDGLRFEKYFSEAFDAIGFNFSDNNI